MADFENQERRSPRFYLDEHDLQKWVEHEMFAEWSAATDFLLQECHKCLEPGDPQSDYLLNWDGISARNEFRLRLRDKHDRVVIEVTLTARFNEEAMAEIAGRRRVPSSETSNDATPR